MLRYPRTTELEVAGSGLSKNLECGFVLDQG